MSFHIHRQLLADCHLLGRLTHCWVLLHRNASVPWFILVPETDCGDLLDLPHQERDVVTTECARISDFVKDHWRLSKVNFAAIGNKVSQMHLHVIGRSPDDSCWPRVVWGNLESDATWKEKQVEKICADLEKALTARGEHFACGPDVGRTVTG